MARIDGREFDQIRDLKITRNYTKYAEGSVFIEMASKGDIQEKKHYLDELQYIVNRCRDILNNNGSIEIFKEYTNAPEETVKIIDNINDFDELVEHMNNIHSIKIK